MTAMRLRRHALNSVCELITDGTHYSPVNGPEGQYLYVTSKNVRPGRIDLSDTSYVTREVHDEIYGGCPVRKGDVLFVKDGVNTGTAAINDIDEPFSMLSSVALVRPERTKLDERYLMHWFNSPDAHCRMLRNMSGSAIRRLILREIRLALIPLPPLAEQRRIVAILDTADALRAKRRQAIVKLDQLAQSIFLEMFGDPVANPKGWPRTRLSLLCRNPDDVKCGPFGTQLAKSEFTIEGIPLWGIKHVNANFGIATHEFLATRKANELTSYSLQPGDIVMTRKGTVGNCAVYPNSLPLGIMHSDLLRVRVDGTICDAIFLSHQLHHSRDVDRQMQSISGGAIMPGINVTKLKQIQVLKPPIKKQREFSGIIAQVHALKASQEAALERIGAVFASLQHRAFRGEL